MATYLKIRRFVDDNLTGLVYDWNRKEFGETTKQLEALINERNAAFQVKPLNLKELLLDALVYDYIQKESQK